MEGEPIKSLFSSLREESFSQSNNASTNGSWQYSDFIPQPGDAKDGWLSTSILELERSFCDDVVKSPKEFRWIRLYQSYWPEAVGLSGLEGLQSPRLDLWTNATKLRAASLCNSKSASRFSLHMRRLDPGSTVEAGERGSETHAETLRTSCRAETHDRSGFDILGGRFRYSRLTTSKDAALKLTEPHEARIAGMT